MAKQSEEKMLLGGVVGDRFNANLEQWLLPVPYTNPGMFEMFRQRDKEPMEPLVAWYGEFPGKYLTSTVLSYSMSHDERLRSMIEYTVDELAQVQGEDGYLGVFSKENRLSGKVHPVWGDDTHWDLWNHYHCMLGLLLWYRESGNKKALEVCQKAADAVCKFFLEEGSLLEDAGNPEKNLSISHIFALLYEETGEPRYLEMTNALFSAFESEGCGDFFNSALAGIEFYKMEKPRWEGLHCVEAIYEMYRITGDERYKSAVENIWWSILETDRHNTGGFSSGEQAQGNPYDLRAVETCCTIAWNALSIDMLHLTDDSYVADELELSFYNGILGAQHPSGRYFVYNAPMVGDKKSSAHEIVFQARPGSPELNCCSVNGPRGIGMLDEWGVTVKSSELTVNYYGESETTRLLEDGRKITIQQKTHYPIEDTITINLKLERPTAFKLRLRIPFWSEASSVLYRQKELPLPEAGRYYEIENTFRDGDEITLKLDFSLHYWAGDFELGGKTSIYRGPILMAYDQRFNIASPSQAPVLSLNRMEYQLVDDTPYPTPWILGKWKSALGEEVYLCDYATAGASGTEFTTWLPLQAPLPAPKFSQRQPVWGYRQSAAPSSSER